MEERFQVGVITTPHGVRGEVKVFPTTDDAKRFRRLKEVILDTGKENLTLEIESVKFFKQFVILKFKGLETPEEVAKYDLLDMIEELTKGENAEKWKAFFTRLARLIKAQQKS